jgi:hypothetical protein
MLKITPFQKYTSITFQTFNADVGAQPYNLPFIAATRMLLSQAHNIPQLYLHKAIARLPIVD